MIKAIVFDLDNTLIDFLARKENAINASINAFLDAGLPTTFRSAKKEIYQIYSGFNMEDPRIFQKYLTKFGKENDSRLLAKALFAYRKARMGGMYAFPRVRKTLLELSKKKIIMGILSDAPSIKVWLRLVEIGLEDFFDFVITLDDTNATKATNIPFDIVKKQSCMNPHEILFVGDLPERDIVGGKLAGFKTVFASYGYYKGMLPRKLSKKKVQEIVVAYKPDYVLYKFDDILKVLKKENRKKGKE